MRNLTDFRKTVETGVDPRLIPLKSTNWTRIQSLHERGISLTLL